MSQWEIHERDEAVALEFRDGYIWIKLRDGRIVGMPISFFEWLDQATPEQRENFKIYPDSILWDELDEGIDLYAFITGDWTRKPKLIDPGAHPKDRVFDTSGGDAGDSM